MPPSSVSPKFCRAQYVAIAATLADLREQFDDLSAGQFGVECSADAIARMFAADNPRFDNQRFRDACGIVGES